MNFDSIMLISKTWQHTNQLRINSNVSKSPDISIEVLSHFIGGPQRVCESLFHNFVADSSKKGNEVLANLHRLS